LSSKPYADGIGRKKKKTPRSIDPIWEHPTEPPLLLNSGFSYLWTDFEFEAERKAAEEAALKDKEERQKNEELRKEASAKKMVIRRFYDVGPLNTDGVGRTKLEGFHTAKAPGKRGFVVKKPKEKRAIVEKGRVRSNDMTKKPKQKGGRHKKKSWLSEDSLVDVEDDD
jgi:hypothetical protein